jgi:hypothetical protein
MLDNCVVWGWNEVGWFILEEAVRLYESLYGVEAGVWTLRPNRDGK